ncbi:MAG: ComEC/Rec2 family competence protein [Verrucomicrobiales bacterium]|nr:ComEC/Rec2 family competence protein [Verrucomicrobiales bacterium]
MKKTLKRWRKRGGELLILAPLFVVCLFAMVGIVAVDLRLFPLAGLVIVSLAGLSMVSWKREGTFVSLFVASIAVLLVAGGVHENRLRQIASFPFAVSLGEGDSFEVEISGWVASQPNPRANSTQAIVEVEAISISGEPLETRHRVPVLIRKGDLQLEYGDRIRATGVLSPLDPPMVPGGFDAREFYFRQSGSLGQFEVSAGDEFEMLEGRRGWELIRFAHRSRAVMEELLLRGLSSADLPYAGLIAAMSLGARDSAPADIEELFKLSGTTHLFAVSGMHVAIVGGLFLGLALLLRIPKRRAIWIVIPLILFYAVLTGLRPSAVRAAVMFSIFLLGFGIKESPRLFNLLGCAALLILLVDTQQLFLPGFQLSFTVLFFIALFGHGLRKLIEAPFRSDPFIPRRLINPMRHSFNAGVSWFAAILAISVTSWIGSAGWLSWHFHSLAPVGVIANLFMVPLAGLVIMIAFASLVLSALHLGPVVALLNQLNVGAAILLTSWAQFFATLPGATHHVGSQDLSAAFEADDTLRIDSMGAFGAAANLIQIPLSAAAGGQTWVIDSGDDLTYRNQLLPLLRYRGINHIDSLVITHGDMAHIGAAPGMIAHFRPGLLLESNAENRSPVYSDIRDLCDLHSIQRLSVSAGGRIEPGEGIHIEVLAPEEGNNGRLADDRALVMKLVYGDWSVLFSSDAGFETEKKLLEAGVNLRADVWIRGQHSASPSGLPAFLEAISPRVVISSHADFPASEAIPERLRENLRERGIPLFDYQRHGMVSLSIEPEKMRVSPYKLPGEGRNLFKK